MGEEIRRLRILVTGGQGFLGGNLVRALVGLGFSNVAATARRKAPELEGLGIEVVGCDLCDREQVLAATGNRDIVFHTAAKAGVWGSEDSYYDINVKATEYLLEGAEQGGATHFIHTSTPSVTFQGGDSLKKDESAPYGKAPLNAYCKTKIDSERMVLDEKRGLQCLALRPHLIYGPGDPHLLPRVFEAARSGRLVRVGDGLNKVDVTHIRDAVGSQLYALTKLTQPEAWGEAYFITSGIPIRLWSWLAHILQWNSLPGVRKSLSLKRASQLGALLERVYDRLGKTNEPPLTEFSALQLGCHHTFSIEKARHKLGYIPTVHPYADFDEQFHRGLDDWTCFRSLFSDS